jgi:hypothetical protein
LIYLSNIGAHNVFDVLYACNCEVKRSRLET